MHLERPDNPSPALSLDKSKVVASVVYMHKVVELDPPGTHLHSWPRQLASNETMVALPVISHRCTLW